MRRGVARRTVLLIRSLFHAPRGEFARAAAHFLEYHHGPEVSRNRLNRPGDPTIHYRYEPFPLRGEMASAERLREAAVKW